MESNKDEARRAMDIAELKLTTKDYVGAKKLANKARSLDPDLAGLEQLLMMIDVYIFASRNGKGEEADWYGVLGVDPLADDVALKKQYKKLALLLHPDKNKCKGAEEAFKLVLEAWSLLSDHSKRSTYDHYSKTTLNNMESDKHEARRTMDIAELKLSIKDYVGAKKLANKARNLDPDLSGLEQLLIMIDVYIFASKKGKGEEGDWYGVLGVDPLADDEALKKQYKKLSLLLHPDKNKCKGAEEAFKLVLEAWSILSDHSKRSAYDQKRKPKPKPKPKPQEPDSSFSFWSQPGSSNKPKCEPKPKSEPNPNPSCSTRKEKERVIDFVQAYFAKKNYS